MMVEQLSDEAYAYHRARFMYWQAAGHSIKTAEEKADWDLLEWSKPLPLPENIDYEDMWT